MAFSIVELVVYGGIGYAGVVLLMVSVLTNPPTNRSLAGARSMFLLPSVLCLSILMFSDANISLDTNESTILTYNETNDLIFNETSTTTNSYNLVNPIWNTVHFAFFIILIIYILIQVISILTKPQ